MKLTVYFDDQFWVGVVEEIVDSKLIAARFVFGAEPHDADVLWFINHQMVKLLTTEKPSTCEASPKTKAVNPKRLARQVAKEMQAKGIASFSQEVIKEDLKNRKLERHVQSKLQRDELAEKKRQIAALKAKAKHSGR